MEALLETGEMLLVGVIFNLGRCMGLSVGCPFWFGFWNGVWDVVVREGVQSCFMGRGLVVSSLRRTCTMRCFVGMGVFAVRLVTGIVLPQRTGMRLLGVENGGVWVDLFCVWFMWIQFF